MTIMDDKLFSVKNMNIVITGTSGLLGNTYARALLLRGANVALIDIQGKESKKLQKEFENTNKVIFYKCDW